MGSIDPSLIDAPPSGYSPSPDVLRAIAQIESGGDPNASTGSYKGLYQLSQDEFNRYGGQGSIYDPAENTRIAQMKIRDEGSQLAKALGRPVTDAEVYLAHQQGVGGATAHLSNPDQSAWQSMAQTAEGRQKGPGWAKQAIWGNVPDQAKAQFGNVDNITSGQFADLWRQRFGRAVGQPQQAAALPQGQPQNAQAGTAAPANRLLAGMPPQPAPIFPQQAQAAPQQQAAAAPSPLEQIPPAQAPPIFYAPRKPINLSALRAALSGYPKG